MGQTYNIYCDESCHLENDHQRVMVLGAIWCPKDKAREAFDRIREIKEKHNLSRNLEIKWTKVSIAKKMFYLDLIDYFFDNPDLHFRAVISYKTKLDHKSHKQTHEDWYYKQYYQLIHPLLTSKDHYNIYLDIKDTRGPWKRDHLRGVLANKMYDYDGKIIKGIQAIRSEEVELLQLADLLLGALGYVHKEFSGNQGKLEVIKRIRKHSGHSLVKNTFLREFKFNLFIWHPSEPQTGAQD